MPSRPSLHAFANTTAPSAASASPNKIPLTPSASLLPRLDRAQAQIVPVETRKVEGASEASLRRGVHERAQVAPLVVSEHDPLPVDQRPAHRQTTTASEIIAN
jgi:hypothetical protein